MADIGQTCLHCFHRELLILVGTEKLYKSYGNKMMFMAPAVRDVKLYAGLYDVTTVLFFGDGYNAAEKKAFKDAAENASISTKQIDVVEIAAIDEVFKHMNTLSYENRVEGICAAKKVSRLNIYAHGDYKGIHFGYELTNPSGKGNQSLMHSNIGSVDNNGLSTQVDIWSYACRTGVSVKGDDFDKLADAKPENSLAQAMARTWDRKVNAWYTRTYYGGIWNDKGDKTYQSKFIEIEDNDTTSANPLSTIKDWIQDKDGKVLWNPQGAYSGITGADTPTGLPNTPVAFKPYTKDEIIKVLNEIFPPDGIPIKRVITQ